MTKVQISRVVLPSIINVGLKHGVDMRSLLINLGISFELDHIEQSTITLEEVHSIVMGIEKASLVPAIGLEIGEKFFFDYLPHVVTFLETASSLREALKIINPLKYLITSIIVFDIDEDGQYTRLKLLPEIQLSNSDEQHFAEMVFSVINSTVFRLSDNKIRPHSILFRNDDHQLKPFYEKFFDCPVSTGKSASAIVYESQIFDTPLSGGLPELHQQAKQLVNKQIDQLPVDKKVTLKVTKALNQNPEFLSRSIEQTAKYLAIGPRTLQRRLAEEGVGFNELRDQIKFKIAAQNLKSEQYSIEEIAESLGFSDRHSFTNAFKRWAGMPPTSYRKKLQK